MTSTWQSRCSGLITARCQRTKGAVWRRPSGRRPFRAAFGSGPQEVGAAAKAGRGGWGAQPQAGSHREELNQWWLYRAINARVPQRGAVRMCLRSGSLEHMLLEAAGNSTRDTRIKHMKHIGEHTVIPLPFASCKPVSDILSSTEALGTAPRGKCSR